MNKLEQWEKRSKESIIAYESFQKFLLQEPPRSIENYPINGIAKDKILGYYQKWKWQKRAAAFDKSQITPDGGISTDEKTIIESAVISGTSECSGIKQKGIEIEEKTEMLAEDKPIETLKELKERAENNFLRVCLKLLEEFNKKTETYIAQAENCTHDDILKLLSAAGKAFSDFRKNEFTEKGEEFLHNNFVNEIIINDEISRDLLLALKERLENLPNVENF